MALVYLDSGVLIAANRPHARGHAAALALLSGLSAFASSDLVRLEVLPKAVFHGQRVEVEFYRAYFAVVHSWAHLDRDLTDRALAVAEEYGLGGMDALHVAAAERVGAAEFVTVERPTSPLLRVTLLPVRSLSPLGA